MIDERSRRLAFAWHMLDLIVAAVGLGWSAYHLLKPSPLVEIRPRR